MAEHIDGPLYYERMGRTGRSWPSCIPIRWTSRAGSFRWRSSRPGIAALRSTFPAMAGRRRPPASPWTTWRRPAGTRSTRWRRASPRSSSAARSARPSCRICITSSPSGPQALILSRHRLQSRQGIREAPHRGLPREGIDYRWDYTFEDLSPAFRATPMAHFFADLFTERNPTPIADDHPSVRGASQARGRRHHSRIACPTIILTGSEDTRMRAAALKERIPGCEMKILHGAGHACQIEQPWLFDRFMIEFLKEHSLFPKP